MASRKRIEAALDRLEPDIAQAFRDAVDEIRSATRLDALVRALESGNLAAAVQAAAITDARWVALTEGIRRAYLEGGRMLASDAPARVGFAFDLNNPRAEAWLRDNSSRLVIRINEDQREAIRIALEAATNRGQGPRRTALDIVGRINRATGRREGGIVGLTSNQARAVESARDDLLSGDPARMGNYFSRGRRDRRFDRIVQRAIDEGRPVAAADVQRITARYSDRLLELRGSVIARTEALQGFNAAQDEALRQAVDQGLVQEQNIVKVWVTASDSRVRDTHDGMNGDRRPLGQPFETDDGQRLMYPGDRSLGASAANIIQCRCAIRQEVDWIAENEL